MTHYAPNSSFLSQRAGMLAGVIALHVFLIYLLASGLASTTISVFTGSIEGTIVDQVDRPPPVPPPADPNFVAPEVDPGPVPLVSVDPSGDTGTALTPETPIEGPPAQAPQPRAVPIRIIGKHRLPNTEDYYPADLRRRGIEGAAVVRVCVDENGKLRGPPTVEQSSGTPRLDEGAINVAKDGRYARSMQGDAYVPNCHGFRIIFKMN